MKKIGYFFITLLSMVAKAQPTPTVTLKAKIESSKTVNHINIPGTRLYLIPPTGFGLVKAFTGLQRENLAVINVTDSFGVSFFDLDVTSLKASYEKLGAKVLSDKSVTVQGYPGRYLMLQASANTYTHFLIFGDNTFCTHVVSAFPLMRKDIGDDILGALNTIYYEKQREVYPLDTAGFTIDDKLTTLKYFAYERTSKIYAYAVGGSEDNLNGKQPFLLVKKMPDGSANSIQKISLAADSMNVSEYKITNPVKKNILTHSINGASAYQTETFGKINGVNSVIYCCVITNGKLTFLLNAVSSVDLANSLSEFKKLAATFRFQ